MRLVSDGEMEAYKGLTVGGHQAKPMEVIFARRSNARDATFLAAFTFGKEKAPPELRILQSDAEEMVGEIRMAGKAYRVMVRPRERKAAVEE